MRGCAGALPGRGRAGLGARGRAGAPDTLAGRKHALGSETLRARGRRGRGPARARASPAPAPLLPVPVARPRPPPLTSGRSRQASSVTSRTTGRAARAATRAAWAGPRPRPRREGTSISLRARPFPLLASGPVQRRRLCFFFFAAGFDASRHQPGSAIGDVSGGEGEAMACLFPWERGWGRGGGGGGGVGGGGACRVAGFFDMKTSASNLLPPSLAPSPPGGGEGAHWQGPAHASTPRPPCVCQTVCGLSLSLSLSRIHLSIYSLNSRLSALGPTPSLAPRSCFFPPFSRFVTSRAPPRG